MIGPHGERLLFAISQPRAGSTLLQRILAAHPAIYATAEPWLMLHPLYALRERGHTADYNAEWARTALRDFCSNLEGGEEAYRDAVRTMGVTLYNKALEPSGREWFLDKTPRYYLITAELRRTFPKASFVFPLRNPLAVLASILASWIKDDWERLELYQDDLLKAPALLSETLREFGSMAFQVRYEELVETPERVMRELCGRLEVPFDPGMLEYGNHPKPRGRMGDDIGIHQHSRPVRDSKDKWIQELAAPRERLAAECYLACLDESVLARLGYPKRELLQTLRSVPVSRSITPLPSEWLEAAMKVFQLPPRTVQNLAREVERGFEMDPGSRAISTAFTPSPFAPTPSPAQPMRRAAQQCVEEADEQFAAGRLASAREWLERALDLEPYRPELLTALANLQSQAQDFEGAYGSLARAAELRPEDAVTQVLLGSMAARLGKIDQFEAALARALEVSPGHPAALRLLAGLNLQQQRYNDAIRVLREILRLDAADCEALLSLGKCLFHTQDFGGAAAAFEAALKLQPNHPLAEENLGVVRQILAQASAASTGPAAAHASPPTPSTPATPATSHKDAAPLVSVIVSVYAAERFIRACLEDLMAQTIFEQLEILVIDSGSPENERAIVEELQSRHPNIFYHRTERETLYAAWNRAIDLARGQFIANANADDAHRPDALERLVEALQAHPEAELAYGDYYTSSVPNDSFANPHIIRHIVHPPYHPATAMMYCLTGCHPLWRRTVFDELGRFDPTFTAPGDYEFLLRFVQAKRRAVHVPQPLSLFYQNPDGLSWKSAAQTKNEGDRILGKYRTQMPIESLFRVEPQDAVAVARAWTALGNVALQHEMPWFTNSVQAVPYARMCYERALQADSRCVPARENLVILRLLQPNATAGSVGLNELPAERAAAIKADFVRGRLYPIAVDAPPAVEPLEHGVPASAHQGRSDAVLPRADNSKHPVELPLRLVAPFLNHSELATEARHLVQELLPQVHTCTYDLSEPYSHSFASRLPASTVEQLDATRPGFNFAVGGIGLCFQAPGRLNHVQGAAYQIGRTFFEADRLPREAVRICNQMDELWLPSRFTAEVFEASGVDPGKLVVIPGSVDPQCFAPELAPPWPLPRPSACNFLARLDWSTRTGWDVLLNAYWQEFTSQDDVCLYLHVRSGERPPEEARGFIEQQIQDLAKRLQRRGRTPHYQLLLEERPLAELPRLYSAVHAVVCPSRGESWNRTALEAMMMARPVIATDWGAHRELITEETGYPLNFEVTRVKNLELHEWPYYGAQWAEPSVAHLRQLMRHLQRNPDEARARGARAREFALQHFSTEIVSTQLRERLAAIEEKLAKPSCPTAHARSFRHRIDETGPHSPSLAQPEVTASVADRAASTHGPAPGPASSSRHKVGGARKAAPSLHVSLEGSFLDLGSFSHVNRELAAALANQRGITLTRVAKNVVPPELSKHKLLLETARRLKYPAPQHAQVTIRHAWPPTWERPASGAWVLIQPWEFGVLPEDWTQRLTDVDEIWAPSDYVRRVYLESGVEPHKVKIVPNGIDPERFRPEAPALALATKKTFKFLFVGGTIPRKGPDLLLKAYLENFTAADDVCLVLKDFGGQGVYAGQTFEAQIRAAQADPDAPEILHLTQDLAPEDLPGLYTACDCLVHPYRGEGFGLPVLEAMACGLPVIVTGGGSTDDFATDEFAYRIPALRRALGPKVGDLKLHRNGWWLEADLSALAERMKWVAAYPDVARKKGEAASEHVRREWTWERAAQIAAARLQDLLARREVSLQPPTRSTAPIDLPPVARLGHLAEARQHVANGQLAEAWRATTNALRLRPFHPEAFLLLAEIAQQTGDAKQAKEWAQQARQMAPKWKPAHSFLKKPPPKGNTHLNLPPLPAHWRAAGKSPRLSVFLITRNEERFLGRCLESIRDVATQIVVADTGSNDATRDIAGRYGAEVLSVDWTDDFSAARNAALEQVTGDWVLMLDADEELLPEQQEALQAALRNPKALAYRLPMIDVGREEEGVSYVPRLFRNAPGLFYVGRVHEQVFSSLEVRRAEWGLENLTGTVRLLHKGYTKEVVRSRDKIARNLKLLQRALEELPGEPNLLMNLGLELVRAGYLDEGVEQYSLAFRALSALPPEEIVPELRESLLTQFCTHLMTVKDYATLGRALTSPLARQGGLTASMHWLFGLACLECRQFAEGAEQMRQCVAKRHQPVFSPVNKNILKAGPNHCLAICLAALKQTEAAHHAFAAALKDDPKARPVQFDYARFLADSGHGLEALKLIHQLAAQDPSNPQLWQFGGQVALSQPEFAEFADDWTGEALRLFPAQAALLEQRAQALLVNGRAEEAVPFWNHLVQTQPANPAYRAAQLLCLCALDQPLPSVPAPVALRVNQDFLAWYRRLLALPAGPLIRQLNERLDALRLVVPGAVQLITAALAEAGPAPVG
jgi:glycosyltransferase involved in cell wall biosynthesis/Flp pilus assembly protein TadD